MGWDVGIIVGVLVINAGFLGLLKWSARHARRDEAAVARMIRQQEDTRGA